MYDWSIQMTTTNRPISNSDKLDKAKQNKGSIDNLTFILTGDLRLFVIYAMRKFNMRKVVQVGPSMIQN